MEEGCQLFYLRLSHMTIQGVVFDFDNTIATLDVSTFLRHPVKATVLKEMKEICDQHRGFRLSNFSRRVAQSTARKELLEQHDQYSIQLYKKQHIHHEIHKIIQYCDQNNIARAVLSDHPCIQKLQAIGLSSGWSAIVHCRHYQALKPLPDALFAVSAQLGIAPSTLLMIGDRWDTDALMAYHAGTHFIHSSMLKTVLQQIRCINPNSDVID